MAAREAVILRKTDPGASSAFATVRHGTIATREAAASE